MFTRLHLLAFRLWTCVLVSGHVNQYLSVNILATRYNKPCNTICVAYCGTFAERKDYGARETAVAS
jgi:hypothetical protein